MKFRINTKSAKKALITDDSELLKCTKDADADDRCNAVSLAMKEASADKIESKYLPLAITIEEIEQQTPRLRF